MARNLDVPDEMTVRAMMGARGVPLVEFYTGRFTVRYDAAEVRRLVSVLEAWLREHGEGADPQDRRPEG